MMVQLNASSLASVKNNAAARFAGGLGSNVVSVRMAGKGPSGVHMEPGVWAADHPDEYAQKLLNKVDRALKSGKSPNPMVLARLSSVCGHRLLMDA